MDIDNILENFFRGRRKVHQFLLRSLAHIYIYIYMLNIFIIMKASCASLRMYYSSVAICLTGPHCSKGYNIFFSDV